MDLDNLTLQVATIAEEVTAVNRYLLEIVPAVHAMRRALEEVSPDQFESAYMKYFSALDCELIRQALAAKVHSLTQLAQSLRQQQM